MAYKEQILDNIEVSVGTPAFYATRIQGNYDKAATPKFEDDAASITGENSIGEAVADGDVLTDITDTQRKTRVLIEDDTLNDPYQFNLILDGEVTNNFAIVDNHGLRTSYPADLGDTISIYHDTNSSFAGATKLVPNRVVSGVINSNRPFYNFDGVDDKIISSSFSPATRYTLEVDFIANRFDDVTLLGNSALTSHYLILTDASTAELRVSGNITEIALSVTLIAGTRYLMHVTSDANFNIVVYIDGVAVGTTTQTSNSIVINQIGALQSTAFFDGSIFGVAYYTRVLAPKEIEHRALYLEGHAPTPYTIGTISDFTEWNNDDPIGYTLDSQTKPDPEISQVGSGEAHGGTGTGSMNFFTSAGVNMRAKVVLGLTVGTTYNYELVVSNVASGTGKLNAFNGTGDYQSFTAAGTYTGTFVAIDTGIRFGRVSGATDYTIDSIWITDPLTLTNFPLEGDKWSTGVEIMPNVADRDFSGANAWVNVDISGAFNAAGDLTIEAGGVDEYCTLPVASAPMTAGITYTLSVDGSASGSMWDVQDFTGVQTFGTIVGDGTRNFITFTVDSGITGGFRIVSNPGFPGTDFDNFSLKVPGAVAYYQDTGIQTAKWYDQSTNDLDGTVTSATTENLPTTVNGFGDMTLIEFAGTKARYWFYAINDDGETSVADTSYGQILLGSKFLPRIRPDFSVVKESSYGIIGSETLGGRRSTNRVSDKRRSWALQWEYVSADDIEEYQEFFDTIETSEGISAFPFWWTPNADADFPIYYYARIVGSPVITEIRHEAFSVSMVIESEV